MIDIPPPSRNSQSKTTIIHDDTHTFGNTLCCTSRQKRRGRTMRGRRRRPGQQRARASRPTRMWLNLRGVQRRRGSLSSTRRSAAPSVYCLLLPVLDSSPVRSTPCPPNMQVCQTARSMSVLALLRKTHQRMTGTACSDTKNRITCITSALPSCRPTGPLLTWPFPLP